MLDDRLLIPKFKFKTKTNVTMKKTYISPSVEVININGATQLMAGSSDIKIISDGTKVDTSTSGAQLGRENNGSSSVWDQEW